MNREDHRPLKRCVAASLLSPPALRLRHLGVANRMSALESHAHRFVGICVYHALCSQLAFVEEHLRKT